MNIQQKVPNEEEEEMVVVGGQKEAERGRVGKDKAHEKGRGMDVGNVGRCKRGGGGKLEEEMMHGD